MKFLGNIGISKLLNLINQIFAKKTDLVPIGSIIAYAKNTIPSGYLLCDGSAISRTTYANLYSAIGTTYGAGNNSTTFNLPNLIDRVIQGNSVVGTYRNAGLPNITGTVGSIGGGEPKFGSQSGAFSPVSTVNYLSGTTNGSGYTRTDGITFDASRSSSIYGNSSTVQPPALTMKYIIKY